MKRTRGKKEVLKKEEIADDWCFKCKDGGELRICDYKDCLKAYHSHCVEKDESWLSSNISWICNCHICYNCDKKATKYYCYFCPKALCRSCIPAPDFVHVKGKYGICKMCLNLAHLIEMKREYDYNGVRVDFTNRNTIEGLFKEFYDINKEKVGLTIEALSYANSRLKAGKTGPRESDSEEFEEDEDSLSDFDSDEEISHKKKGPKSKILISSSQQKKRNYSSSKKQFIGWASIALIQFLKSLGKDTSEKLTIDEVAKIIEDYVKKHKLNNQKKNKKMINCDEKLKTILSRSVVNKNNIKRIIGVHFADNEDDTSDDSSDEDEINLGLDKDEEVSVGAKRQRVAKKVDENTPKEEPQSEFAAVISENLKLVYLKRGVVNEMVKDRENLIIGSFIRVKTDPMDFNQRNSHMLMQVTGIEKGLNDANVIYIVSDMPSEICPTRLSNVDFTEAEIEDLRNRIQAGIVKKPTMVEFEEKAKSLHYDITKHWIERELTNLQPKIDQANERGQRREFDAMVEKKKLLETKEEQERLFNIIPKVIPEKVDPTPVSEDEKKEEDRGPSPQSTLDHKPEIKKIQNMTRVFSKEETVQNMTKVSLKEETLNVVKEEVIPKGKEVIIKEVIDLSSDDEVEEDNIQGVSENKQNLEDLEGNISGVSENKQNMEDLESEIWHLSGTDGEDKTPYSITALKRWNEISSYASKVKVWKDGQSEDMAIPLTDAIKLYFP